MIDQPVATKTIPKDNRMAERFLECAHPVKGADPSFMLTVARTNPLVQNFRLVEA